MPKKPRLLLLDAGAIIVAFQSGGWDALCKAYEIIVPSIIIDEAHFYTDADGCRHPIDLQPLVDAGTIQGYEAPLAEFKNTRALLHPELRERVHDGEQEALTYLRTHSIEGVAFVVGDGGAVEAAVALDVAECALSLESALRMCGLTKRLPEQHTEAFVKRKIGDGYVRVVQGRARA